MQSTDFLIVLLQEINNIGVSHLTKQLLTWSVASRQIFMAARFIICFCNSSFDNPA